MMAAAAAAALLPRGRGRGRATFIPYRSHIIFDDSVHPLWSLLPSSKSVADAHWNASVLRAGEAPASCARSLRLVLSLPMEHVRLRAAVAMRGHAAVSLQFWARASERLAEEQCDSLGQFTRPGWRCTAAVCVSLRHSSEPEAAARFLPLCAFAKFNTRSWRRVVVPASAFAADIGATPKATFDEIVFLAGGRAGEAAATGAAVELVLDEVVLMRAAGRPTLPGPRGAWQGPRANAPVRRAAGWCQYLSTAVPPRRGVGAMEADETAMASVPTLPPCKVADGDHLPGMWMQNCAPESIRRPDRYAYGQSVGRHAGQWDYRLCFKMGYVERERSRLALSYTWRPHRCSLQPVRGARFSSWLGARTLLFWGDSLTAQHFFSLVLLLGDAVVSIRDVTPDASSPDAADASIASARQRAASSRAARDASMCAYDGLGAEGGVYTEAILRGGGRLVKVLGHAEMADQLATGFAHAWWRREWERADLIVFNYVGHHLRTLDPSFGAYAQRVGASLRAMAAHTKQHAQLIMRVSNLGHPGCETELKPLTSNVEAWRRLGGPEWRAQPGFTPAYYGAERAGPDAYDWRAPPLREGEWAAQLRDGSATGASRGLSRRFTVLNVSHVDRRSDGHVGVAMRQRPGGAKDGARDCLHYCMPCARSLSIRPMPRRPVPGAVAARPSPLIGLITKHRVSLMCRGPSDAWAAALYNLLLNDPERFGRAASAPQ